MSRSQSDELKAALDAAPRKSPIILTNSEGKPWSESGFQGAWGKATVRAGIRGLTFHDLRGTAVVTYMFHSATRSVLTPDSAQAWRLRSHFRSVRGQTAKGQGVAFKPRNFLC
jgi:integrase